MNYLKIGSNYLDPEKMDLEVVERKGLGHPDTLADALAELVSIDYSKFCLEKFGYVLHHNLDKFYIGAGLFKSDFGFCEKVKPVQVIVNGRISDSYNGQKIDLVSLQRKSILGYLKSIFPRSEEFDFAINHNATQNSRLPNWFSPRSVEDLPEYSQLRAGDNAFCVFSWPLTTVENLVYSLEGYFWDKSGEFPQPKFSYLGQDIKVMACRQGEGVNVGLRVPIISTYTKNRDEYRHIVESVQKDLVLFASEIAGSKYHIDLELNAHKPYLLGFGSCIECGEEGLVGRGNSNSGVISVFRPHTTEAPSGKNPVYHTGRVLNFLVMSLSKAIFKETGAKNTVLAVTKNGGSLVPPFMLSVNTEIDVSRLEIERIVEKYFLDLDYLTGLLSERQIN